MWEIPHQLLDYPLHFIGVEGTEAMIGKYALELDKNFKEVTQEIVPYVNFADGSSSIVLKESVREKNVTFFTDPFGKYSPKSIKPNDRFFHELALIQCAKNHWAKQITMRCISQHSSDTELSLIKYNETALFENVFGPAYSIPKAIVPSTSFLTPEADFVKETINDFQTRDRLYPFKKEKIHLIGTQDTQWITESIKQYLSSALWDDIITSEISYYKESDIGITEIDLKESFVDKHVYVIGDVNGKKCVEGVNTITYNDRLMQQFLLLKHAREYKATTINFIPTCFPYSREDKPSQWGLRERVKRQPSLAQYMIAMIEHFGVDYCITMDIHNPAVINSSAHTKFVNLYTWRAIQHVLDLLNLPDKDSAALAPMDEGWGKKVAAIAKDLNIQNLTVIKTRNELKINTVDEISVFWDVQWKDILIHDDILDTWWSLLKLIEKLYALGARSINVVITHGMFNTDKDGIEAIAKLQALYDQKKFGKIYITNTIYRDKEFYPDWVEIIDAAPNFADPIWSIYSRKKINYNRLREPVNC